MRRISRHTMHRCQRDAVVRLARWLGMRPKSACTCDRCFQKLVERLMRHPELA